jgi:hypothetical protein
VPLVCAPLCAPRRFWHHYACCTTMPVTTDRAVPSAPSLTFKLYDLATCSAVQHKTPQMHSSSDNDINFGPGEISMSQHLSKQVSTWIDPDATVERKLEKAKMLDPFLREIDGYLSFSSSWGR